MHTIHRFFPLAALGVLAALLTGCSDAGTSPDDKTSAGPSAAEWKEAVEARIGHSFRNDAAWQQYQDVYTGEDGLCSRDDLSMTVAVFTDEGTSVSEIEEDFEYACPDRLPALREAAKEVQDSAAKADRICSTDPDLLTQEDRDFYDAVC